MGNGDVLELSLRLPGADADCAAEGCRGRGFALDVHRQDHVRWNLGGWGNERHAVQLAQGSDDAEIISPEVQGRIEPKRWYDIRVEVTGRGARCYLDDKLIHDITYPATRALYSVAGSVRDDVIVKLVNVSADDREVNIVLEGTDQAGSKATLIQLTSEKPEDENSLENPKKVIPQTNQIDAAGNTIKLTLPGNSVNVIRIPASK